MADPTRTKPAAYRRIMDDLRRKIGDGTYPVGTALPAISDLMDTYAETNGIVRRALLELRVEGLIETSQGRQALVLRLPEARSDEFVEATRQLADVLETVSKLEARLQRVEDHMQLPPDQDVEPSPQGLPPVRPPAP